MSQALFWNVGQFNGKLSDLFSESKCQLLVELLKKVMHTCTIGFYFLDVELQGCLQKG